MMERENGAIATLKVDDPTLSICFISKSPSCIFIVTSYTIVEIKIGTTKQAMGDEEKIKLTILPLGVLNGHAEEYSNPVLGRITGCSPTTPTPLQCRERKR